MNPTEEQEKSIRIIGTITLKKEEFITDKTWEGDIVDMTAAAPKMNSTYKEQFFSIQLVNFEIVN